MATKQGYLKEKGSQDKLAPKTLDSLVKDSARNRALSASLQELAERQCLGYPPFATTQNYAVGDKVFHDRKLWKFTSSHTAGAWNASHVTAWSVEDEVSELKLAVTTLDERKANIDGFYEGMGVGVAKRLEGNTDVAGSFLERPTGGDAELANGLAQLNEVQGGSVKFNQVVENGDFSDGATGWSGITSVVDGIATYIKEPTGSSGDYGFSRTMPYISQGKYLFRICAKSNNSVTSIKIKPFEISTNGVYVLGILSDWTTVSVILQKKGSDNRFNIVGNIPTDPTQDTSFSVKSIEIFDLTTIFGAGNEPATVAEFESWLAENVGLQEYYDYTDGEVVNNNMTGIESTGFNLFNPTTGKARIIGAYSEVYGNYYGITGTHGALTFEDDLGNVSTVTPDADGKFELDVSGYLSVADAGNDVAVFLWWDGKKTEYEDYDVEIAHLDVRHIYGKKNGTGELVQVWPTGMPRINDIVDKLCIENGAVVAKRPIGEVDMGSLTWGRSGEPLYTGAARAINLLSTGIKQDASAICSKYTKKQVGNGAWIQDYDAGKFSIGTSTNGSICVNDSALVGKTDAETKTYLTGIKIYYELATPETYTDLVYMGSEYFADGTPVVLPVNYKVDNWGVESILPKNTSTILTAKPTIKVRYAIDAVEQLNTHSDKIEDLYDGLDELDGAKANTVGVYNDMVVGAAKAIAGNQRLDKVFTSMVVEGADGVAKINEVRGKSLVWNQQIEYREDGTYTSGDITFVISSNRIIVNGSAESNTTLLFNNNNISVIGGHKYLLKGSIGGEDKSTNSYRVWTSSNIAFPVGHRLWSYDGGMIQEALGDEELTSSKIYIQILSGYTATNLVFVPQLYDLTQMFGAGNEPATVEEFENLFPDAYYEYNAGEIINNATEELDIYDSEETLKSTLPLNLTTITGKQVGVEDAESVVIFPDGMRQAGSVADTLLVDDDGYARRAVVKIGSVDLGDCNYTKDGNNRFCAQVTNIKRATSANAMSNIVCAKYQTRALAETVLNDGIGVSANSYECRIKDSAHDNDTKEQFKAAMSGVELIYELAEYKEYILDEPILMTFKAYHGGTIVQSPQAPDSAPMSMNVTFALDAVGTLNNLPKNYISADSMDAFLAQLGTAMNGTWTKSWDAANNRYGFTFTPNA